MDTHTRLCDRAASLHCERGSPCRFHIQVDPCDKLVLLICLVYLPLWITMGMIVEVRIFVPFLLLASPTVAKIWGSYVLAERSSPSRLI